MPPEPRDRIFEGRICMFEEGRMKTNDRLSNGSRRTFLQLSAAATAAMAFRIASEATLAADERHIFHPGAVIIDANENPLGLVTRRAKLSWTWLRKAAATPTGSTMNL